MTTAGDDPSEYPRPPGDEPVGQQPSGYPPGGAAVFSVGNAINYGWEKFKANAGVWIGVVVIVYVIEGALAYVLQVMAPDSLVLAFVGRAISGIVGLILGATFIKGALDEVSGLKPDFSAFFKLPNIGTIVIAGILVGIGTVIGLILLIIPGIIFAFLAYWTIPFVIDQNQDAVTAIKSSIAAIRTNIGGLLLLALANFAITVVGLLLFGVGLLVAVPITTIASVWAYRVTIGGPVAP